MFDVELYFKPTSRVRPMVQPGVTVVTDDLVTKSRATNKQITPSYTPILPRSLLHLHDHVASVGYLITLVPLYNKVYNKDLNSPSDCS